MHCIIYAIAMALPVWELTTSLSYVNEVFPAAEGGVWCASSGGAFHYSPQNGISSVFSCPEHLPVPDVNDILEDSAGRLWFATDGGGLVMFDGDGWTSYSAFEGIPGDGRVFALEEAAGEIWAGGSGGFANGGVNGFTPVGDVIPAGTVYSIDSRGDTLWLATDRGIFSLHDPSNPRNPASWTDWPETLSLNLSRIRTGEGSVYACGTTGALELSPGAPGFEYILDYSSSPDSAVVDIRETSQGLLAACHGRIYRRVADRWESLGTGLSPFRWPTLLFETEGIVHAGFSYQTSIIDLGNTQTGLGFFLLQNGSWVNFPIPGIGTKRIHQMVSTADGRIYTGTYSRGVQAYYPGSGWRSYVEEDGMPNSFQTFAAAADPVDGVWASSYRHGLSWIRDKDDPYSEGDTILTFIADTLEWHSEYATIIYQPLLPNNQPVMLASQQGGMWCAFRQFDPVGAPGETSGIMGFNGNPLGSMHWAPRTGGGGIAGVNVRSVYPASADSLWIAFEGGGCQLLVHSGNPADDSADKWSPSPGNAFYTAHGLPSSDVYCFVKVPGVGLLAGTASGLARWTGSGFAQYGDFQADIRAMATDSRGRVWCLSEAGVYRVADGSSTLFTGVNSDYLPAPTYTREYAVRDMVTGGVFLSSDNGLWLVSQAGGGEQNSSGVTFYPQPFMSGIDELRLSVTDGFGPVKAEFFRLDGSHAGTVEALSAEQWSWSGALGGKIVSSGVYMVLVTVDDQLYQARITVVR